MPASLFYSEPPAKSSSLGGYDMDSNPASTGMLNMGCNGTTPTEQLALQLALLQGNLQPHQPEWSTGESPRIGLMDDRNGHSLFNGGGSSAMRGSLEDLKFPPQRKSQNMTECVPVPTSEHVAEIVGRQGCKIKALRAKTNTYIKTPVRGEEPVFVVTGRKEDVALAKREILSAADHFSQIRASRKSNINSTLAFGQIVANQPGQTTQQVRVPYRVVGLVVGPKGATIKRIQQQTRTYIVTPSRDKEPVFEVTGLPENVEVARKEIEAHIAFRTGSSDCGSAEGSTSGAVNGFYNNLNDVNGDDNVFSGSNGSTVLGGGASAGNGVGGGSSEMSHFGRESSNNSASIFSSTNGGGSSGGNLDHLGNNLHHQNGGGINNFHENSSSIFGNRSAIGRETSLLSSTSFDAPSCTGNIGDRPLMNGAGKGITIQNILDSNFDLLSNGIATSSSSNGHGLFQESSNGWGDSQDSGLSNSPPFDKAVNGINPQQEAVERSGSGIWGDLNKALGSMKISAPSPTHNLLDDKQAAHHQLTRSSVDLGTLGRPAMIPLTSSNSLTLIGALEKNGDEQEAISTKNTANNSMSSNGIPATGSTLNYHHPAVVATSSTGSSSVASLSEMSPPNSLPHFLSGDDKAECHEENNLKKLIMIRNEELLRQNERNEKKSSTFDA